MPDVSLERSMPLAPASAWHALRATLSTFVERSTTGDIALTAVARSGDEELARLSVPVRIVTPETTSVPEGAELPLRIHARAHENVFPTFDGTLGAEPLDQADARVRLRGTYTLPAGVLGSVAGAFTLDALAEDSLRRFLDELVDTALQTVREDADTRYREIRGGV